MTRERAIVVLMCLTVALFGVYQMIRIYVLRSSGRFVCIGVEIYEYRNLDKQIDSINWGEIRPNEIIHRRITIKNNETLPITLTITSENWQPSNANQTLTFKVIYDPEKIIHPNLTYDIVLQLEANEVITNVTYFTFDIIVTAIQYKP